jgi:hypothetical protein
LLAKNRWQTLAHCGLGIGPSDIDATRSTAAILYRKPRAAWPLDGSRSLALGYDV